MRSKTASILYFRDSIIADIRRLSFYFGEHRIHLGYFRALSSRFPYAIYYRDVEGTRQVVAVLVTEMDSGSAFGTPVKAKASQNADRGSDFRDFLTSESILPDVEVLGLKRVISLQLQQILEQEHVTKTELASRMKTSRASLDRMLDPSNPSLTVASLGKAAAALGTAICTCLMLIRELRTHLPTRTMNGTAPNILTSFFLAGLQAGHVPIGSVQNS